MAATGLLLLLLATPALAASQPFIPERSTTFSNLTATCATLEANINPEEAATTYHFEYLTQAQFESNEAEHKPGFEGAESKPKPDASIGEDDTFHHVSTEICGLTPRTAYRFRPVATNSQSPAGGTLGPEATFSTIYGSSHELTATFGTEASGDPVPLAGPSDVAVVQRPGPEHGDVYVTDPGVDERQKLTLTATAGTFALGFKGQSTGATGEGNYSATTGTGNLNSHGEVTGLTTEAGTFEVGQRIEGEGIPSGDTIQAIGPGTLTLHFVNTTARSGVALTAGSGEVTGLTASTGAFVPGEQIEGPDIPAATTIAAVGSGTLRLSALPTKSATGASLASTLPFNATAGAVQSALEALSSIGAHNVQVSGGPRWSGTARLTLGSKVIKNVSGQGSFSRGEGSEIVGSGIPPGTKVTEGNSGEPEATLSQAATETASGVPLVVFGAPYEITFLRTLASTAVEPLKADTSALTGGTATLATTVPGERGAAVEKFNEKGEFLLIFGAGVNKKTGAGVCVKGEECQPGTPGSEPGQFVAPTYLAIDESPGGEGDVYVGDPAAGPIITNPAYSECINAEGRGVSVCTFNLVQKFQPTGRLIEAWGVKGQKDGSDISDYPPELRRFEDLNGIAVGPNGILYVGASFGGESLSGFEYTQSGTYISPFINLTSGPAGYKFAPDGNLFGASEGKSDEGGQPGSILLHVNGQPLGKPASLQGLPTTGFAIDPSGEELYQDSGSLIYHYGSECDPQLAPCELWDSFGAGHLSAAAGVAVDGATHTVYVANSAAADVAVFSDIRPEPTTETALEAGETSLKLTGTVNPETNGKDHGPIESCFFEWGLTRSYGHTATCEQHTPYLATEHITARLENLLPISEYPIGTRYHYRLVVANEKGATKAGADRTASTTEHPQIEAVSTSHVTSTSAQLDATIKSNGLPTTYRFQYGTTTAYGETTRPEVIEGSEAQLFELHRVEVPIEDLQRGVTYHLRLIAENALGTVTSEDQTFEFFPPACPNSSVRQQTGSAYLPDCRAYELVSPSNAGGTLLFPGGPDTGQATSPSRFAFTGNFGSVPGQNTIDTAGDLYLATRTDTGWVTHYIGLSGSEAACMGGPPEAPTSYITVENPTELQEPVLADPTMSRVLDWNDGEPFGCAFGTQATAGADHVVDHPSDAPYLWNADGGLIQRLPTDLPAVPGSLAALDCPYPRSSSRGQCTSEVTASPDLTHLVFSSDTLSFSESGQPAGLTQAPGSAYDDNLATGKVKLISTLKEDGEPIPQPQPDNAGPGEFLRFPAVSTDGSHILISTATSGTPECDGKSSGSGAAFRGCPEATSTPVHLYMSIDDEGAVEVSYDELTREDVAVNYVGMTSDGSKVFFTSEQHLTAEDEGHGGASLYMWSAKAAEEEKPAVTLISKGQSEVPGAPGNTAACTPALVRKPVGEEEREVPWTAGCGVVTYSAHPFSAAFGGAGGNGISDTAIASQAGDIYFYSPEQLDGARGVPGLENLYDYRAGHLQFVATFNPEVHCIFSGFGASEERLENKVCSAGPVVRLDVSPDDSHMAFTTATQLTSYENAGHQEMYSYIPSTGNLVCDSCNPSGHPATADVQASQDGLFMTDDGRTFFSTAESLVPQDTNSATDVYEYVAGHPQLITPGTGTAPVSTTVGLGSVDEIPGLIGVSANGADVYFSTFDVLLSEDHNGDFLKFYDARTNGGFPQPPPNQPCAAAEECHGPGTEAPVLPTKGTAAALVGGNVTSASHSHHKKHHKRKGKRHNHRAAHRNRGGSK